MGKQLINDCSLSYIRKVSSELEGKKYKGSEDKLDVYSKPVVYGMPVPEFGRGLLSVIGDTFLSIFRNKIGEIGIYYSPGGVLSYMPSKTVDNSFDCYYFLKKWHRERCSNYFI